MVMRELEQTKEMLTAQLEERDEIVKVWGGKDLTECLELIGYQLVRIEICGFGEGTR